MGCFSRMARLAAGVALMGCALGAAAAGALAPEARTIESETADFRIDARYPHTGVKAIDDEIVAWVNAEVAALKQQGPPDPEWATGAYSLDIDYEVARNDAAVFGVRFNEMTSTGGAHPNHGVRTFNYRMPAAQRIDLAQVIDGERGLARVSALVIADLGERLTAPDVGADIEGIQQGAAPQWSNFENFLLLPDAIEFVFPPYQVAAYVFGTQEASIPLSRLREVLRRDSSAPAASNPAAAAAAQPSASMASFDCARAATPSERAICSDAALAGLDRDLARSYAARLAEAGDAERKGEVKARQRAWLKNRDEACRDQSGAAAVSCLTGVYRARHAELRAQP